MREKVVLLRITLAHFHKVASKLAFVRNYLNSRKLTDALIGSKFGERLCGNSAVNPAHIKIFNRRRPRLRVDTSKRQNIDVIGATPET